MHVTIARRQVRIQEFDKIRKVRVGGVGPFDDEQDR
jgi:hypothetical protein